MKMEGMSNFSEEQKEWVKMQRYMVDANVLVECKRYDGFRGKIFDMIEHKFFDYFITLIIVLNTILMCISYNGSSQTYNNWCDGINYFFLGIFAIEIILKLIAFGPRYYFFIKWNRFDFVIVILSFLVMITYSKRIPVTFSSKLVTVLRIIRVARLLKMIKKSK